MSSAEHTSQELEDPPSIRDGSPLVIMEPETNELELEERILSADDPSHQLDATKLAEQDEPVVLRSEDQAWTSETPNAEADLQKDRPVDGVEHVVVEENTTNATAEAVPGFNNKTS